MTTMTQTAGTASSTPVGFGRLVGQALLGGAAAAVVNLVLFFGGRAAGVPFTGEFQPGQLAELPVPPIVISSLVPAVVAALVALLFQKFTKAPARNFAILATVFCVVSFMGPANVKQIAVSTIVVMNLMHLVAGLGIGGMLYRTLKQG